METLTFDEVQNQIQQHYHNEEYAAALELATRVAAGFPEQAPFFYYWRICMAARLGQPQQSCQILAQAQQQGIWYSEVLLRRSSSLKELQGLSEFERLVAQNRQLQANDESRLFPLIALHGQGACTAHDLPCPLLIGLHGNRATAQAAVNFWRPAASAGWLVAIPQSSQSVWKGAYVWDDLEVTRNEIQRHVAALQRQYAVDLARTVLAGHSMGGEAAAWLALTSAVQSAGFVLLAPGGPLTDEPESWAPLIAAAQAHGLRGYVIAGDQDDQISLGDIEAFVDLLNNGGVPCDLEILPAASHDFSPDYEAALLRGLDFVLSV